MKTLRKLNRIFDRSTKIKLLILLVAIIIGASLEVVALSIIAPFISVLLDPSAIYEEGIFNTIYQFLGFSSTNMFLAFLAITLAAIYLFRFGYSVWLTYVQNRLIANRQTAMSAFVFDKVLSYSYLYHSRKNTAEQLRIVVHDVGTMFSFARTALGLLSQVFLMLFIIVFLIVVSPLMTLFVAVMAGLCVLLYFRLFTRILYKVGKLARSSNIIMTKALNQALGGIKDVKVLQKEKYFSGAYKGAAFDQAKSNAVSDTVSTLPRMSIEAVCFGLTFIAISIALFLGYDISVLVPQLSLFVLAAFRLLPAISASTSSFSNFIAWMPSVDAVYDTLFKDGEIESRKRVIDDIEKTNDETIEIKNLTFTYPGGHEPVLVDVSFSIPKNASIAFVGPTGAGKTTIVDIIVGLITPDEGGVYYNGGSVHRHYKEWSKNIGYVQQQIYLIDESIRENIAFGIAVTDINDDDVWRALEQSQMADFVRTLPGGIDTIVGERGIRLSGGQRQRVGIARALYCDPSIVVFDEATSSLDDDTEAAVMDAITRLKGQMTMIIIAHRLSTITHCDIVYRVDEQKVTREK